MKTEPFSFAEAAKLLPPPFTSPHIERLKRCCDACIGLDLPAEVPTGILADVVTAARELRDLKGRYNTEQAAAKLFSLLAKLGPAAGSPDSTGDGAGPVSAPEEGTYQDLATYRTATGKIALNMARRWRQGEWRYSYNGLRAAGSGHPLKHAQDTVRSMLRHHPKDHLAEGQDILEFTD